MHPHKVRGRYGLSKWMEKGMLCFLTKRKKSHISHKELIIVVSCLLWFLFLCDGNLGYLVEIKDEVHFDKGTRNIKEH